MLNESEAASARALIELALREDLGEAGDITSNAFIPAGALAEAFYVARKPGRLAGLPVAAMVCAAVSGELHFEPLAADGDAVSAGGRLARLSGPVRAMLAAERTSLNFLQRLSGIASLTRQYVDLVAPNKAKILDTRKTTPGWRLLEKYTVRMGGGTNHRIGLYDAILIKDNHIAALKMPTALAAAKAVDMARAKIGHGYSLTVEVDDLESFRSVLPHRADIILLDNMPVADIARAVRERDAAGSGTLLEASGGVNLDTVRAIAVSGVDRISVGALTHSAAALDIGLDFAGDKNWEL